ncbi:uncharacterized protein [Antedon mediterranea]|uniref:uncharacterized protein n=1 Tax=Antedon mediterranea TaxID=105859 RepID=UPI003AF60689
MHRLTIYTLIKLIILPYMTVNSSPSVCDTFECDSDKCLLFISVCDGIPDCLDGTDEGLHCRTATLECVGKHEYLCDDGQCILNTLRCDGSSDCIDGSDEKYCDLDYEEPFCKEFTCDNGQRCLSLTYLCDGNVHCADGTDESGRHCSIPSNDCSNTDEFLCRNGHCLPAMFRCDGSSDCVDNSDEEGCLSSIAPSLPCSGIGEFLCENGHCIPTIFRCDGTTDCLDKSDEQGCITENTANRTEKPKEKPNNQAPPTTKIVVHTYKVTAKTKLIAKLTTPSPTDSVTKTLNNYDVIKGLETSMPVTIENRYPANGGHVNHGNSNDIPTTFRSNNKKTSHHMRSVYAGTVVALTIATVAVIALVMIRRKYVVVVIDHSLKSSDNINVHTMSTIKK